MAITVRAAEAADIPALAAIRAREWETEAYWKRRISGYLWGSELPQQALPGRTVLVAVEEAGVVGFVAGHRTRRFGCDAELEWINVERERRGLGIAARLIREIGAWFVEQGARRVCVNVEPDNAIARRLYQRHGAQPLSAYWMVWEDAGAMLSAPQGGL